MGGIDTVSNSPASTASSENNSQGVTEIYMALALGPTDVRRDNIFTSPIFDFNDYFQVDVALGLGISPKDWYSFVGEIGYSQIHGSGDVAGSSRNQFFLKGGSRFRFADYLFTAVKGGVGVNDTHFNFGESVTLPMDVNLSAIIALEGGVEYCWSGKRCLAAFATPFYEIAIAGDPHFNNYAILGGAMLRYELTPSVPMSEYAKVRSQLDLALRKVESLSRRLKEALANNAEMNERLEAATQRINELQGEVDRLRGEVERLGREGDSLRSQLQDLRSGLIQAQDRMALIREWIRNPLSMFILFNNESSQIPKADETRRDGNHLSLNPELERIADHLKAHPEVKILIHGHAKDTGTDELNKILSRQRAEGVRSYLLNRGVLPEQIVDVKFHGAAVPLDIDPKDPMNRRVNFEEIKNQ